MSDMHPVIELTGVRRHFADRAVLCGLDLRVRPGEVYALLGRNGSGKTTAIRILLGLLDPIAGTAAILGTPSSGLTGAVRERIGYVSEGHAIYPYNSVSETLAFELATRTRFDAGYAEQAVRSLGLSGGERVSKLSRGQRAQLALVLALAGRPEVLVFDDPALGLDVAARRELLDAMIALLADRGTTVLFSSHVMADVERLADRVGILHGGRLALEGSLDALRRRVQRVRVTGRDAAQRIGTAVSAGASTARVIADRAAGLERELFVLDADGEFLEACRTSVAQVEGPVGVNLEEVFVALTGELGALPALPALSTAGGGAL